MWTLFLIFVFLLAYYYFILRKYNTLGFRIFSLCFFVSVAFLYWWVGDWRKWHRMEQYGITGEAIVWEKKEVGSHTQVYVMYHGADYSLEVARCNDGLSKEELAEMVPQQTIQIRYIPKNPEVYMEKSYQRQKRDLPWFLLFPAFFLLLGSASWYFLRQYRVHPHEGTVYEYVTDETGKVVLDDAASEKTKQVKKWGLFSRLLQIFQRAANF